MKRSSGRARPKLNRRGKVLDISYAMLPPVGHSHWWIYDRAVVAEVALCGLWSDEKLREMYRLSEEELSEWKRNYQREGILGLRQTGRQMKLCPERMSRTDRKSNSELISDGQTIDMHRRDPISRSRITEDA
jgi:hypothetical protein